MIDSYRYHIAMIFFSHYHCAYNFWIATKHPLYTWKHNRINKERERERSKVSPAYHLILYVWRDDSTDLHITELVIPLYPSHTGETDSTPTPVRAEDNVIANGELVVSLKSVWRRGFLTFSGRTCITGAWSLNTGPRRANVHECDDAAS